MLTSTKLRELLVLKGMFSKSTYVCVYLPTKFQVSSIILISFRRGNLTYPPQNEPLKSPPRLGLNVRKSYFCFFDFCMPVEYSEPCQTSKMKRFAKMINS